MTGSAELLFEIGCEEIPARMATESATMLRRLFLEALAARDVACPDLQVYVTPRRLVLHAPGLPLAQADRREEKKGPPVAAAYDKDGNPTKAATGFAASLGLTMEQLRRVPGPKGDYLYADVHIPGQALKDFLPQLLSELVAALRFPRAMHWGSETALFVRPVHWIVAVFAGQVLDFGYADVRSGDTTFGHRFHAPAPIKVTSFAQYNAALEAASVLVDPARRRAIIEEGLRGVEARTGLKVVPDPELLEWVTHLVEYPVVLEASFDPRFLELPKEVLVTSMRTHQKYFALEDASGKLAPWLVAVANTRPRDPKVVARGYQRVLKARLHDAMFFLEEDKKKKLEDFLPQLEGRLFLQGLGTMLAKAQRTTALAGKLADLIDPAAKVTTLRAATLAKADLSTKMVYEFPEVQGVMGREYALTSGETPQVAAAIFEHYLPRFAGDELPATTAGALVALADKLDSLTGIFGIGLIPTSTKDPYALRRAALGLVRILMDRHIRVPLDQLFALAHQEFAPGFGSPELTAKLLDFTSTRLKIHLSERFAPEVVDAALATGSLVLPEVLARVEAITAMRSRPDYADLVIAFKRIINISRKSEVTASFKADLLAEEAEKTLWQAFQALRPTLKAAQATSDFAGALNNLLTLKAPIDLYFDKVLVNCEDEALKQNRLAMIQLVASEFLSIADFIKIPA